MAVCKMDIHKKERTLEKKFSLSTIEGVEILLEQLPYLREERFERANFAIADLLMDLELAMKKAKLTPIEETAVELIYGQQLLYREAMVVSPYSDAGLHKALKRAIEKIANAFATWGYDDVNL